MIRRNYRMILLLLIVSVIIERYMAYSTIKQIEIQELKEKLFKNVHIENDIS